MNVTKNLEVWNRFSLSSWELGFKLDFDFDKYRYFSFELALIFIKMRCYKEW